MWAVWAAAAGATAYLIYGPDMDGEEQAASDPPTTQTSSVLESVPEKDEPEPHDSGRSTTVASTG